MVLQITQNRVKGCKNTIGGIKNAYLAPYRTALRSEIVYDGVTLTQFPETFVFKFELIAGDVFIQDGNEDDGGKFYNQNIELTFNKISAFDNLQFQKLLRKDYFIVVEDRNSNFFLLGFRNGLIAEKLETGTGQQYKITFTGSEEDFAPFCEDLMGTDIIIVDGFNKIFQDEDNFVFQDDYNYIFE